MAQPTLLFAYPSPSSFILRDLTLLKDTFSIIPYQIGKDRFPLTSLSTVQGVLLWFASLRFLPLALLAKEKGIPIFIITGGYETADVKIFWKGKMVYRYGNRSRPLKKIFTRLLLSLATKIFSVSPTNHADIKVLHPSLEEKTTLIPHGFPPIPKEGGKKEPFVLTVARITEETLWVKGIYLLLEVAKIVPDTPFILVGGGDRSSMEKVQKRKVPNLTILGDLPHEKLFPLYEKAKVYFQPSYYESFGCATAEAMLFDAIPVVSTGGELPNLVGRAGIVVPKGEPEKMAEGIRKGLDPHFQPEENPRRRVLTHYSLKRRKDLLTKEILSLIG